VDSVTWLSCVVQGSDSAKSKHFAGIGVCNRQRDARTVRRSTTYKIIGAAMAVHAELGCGFLEAVSREAFTIELELRGIPFVREARLPVRYRGRVLPVSYIVDFICYGEIIVELKALRTLGPTEMAQIINYLKAAGRNRGLLLEFRRAEPSV
jgi:GxxExxY protein